MLVNTKEIEERKQVRVIRTDQRGPHKAGDLSMPHMSIRHAVIKEGTPDSVDREES